MKLNLRGPAAALLLLLPLAACGDDGGSGPDRLTSEEVAGVYSPCILSFQPEGGLAAVNLRAAAFETTAAGVQQPALRIDTSREIELVFTPSGQNVSQNVRGTFDVDGDEQVTLRFDERGTVRRNQLLLPDRIDLQFNPSPRLLTLVTSQPYTVPRADYVRLSGQSGANLAEQIRGQLAAQFRVGGCG